ncbi:hypothetical protein JZ751_016872 [Albula glossodonta]|uniref:mRNA m(6)A methyltransferase n=1 Tax=Albula glossodonta TaxID=121402 RepID=A0A8T2MW73_9TELE|nr:hypothetical protein JZ751_011490 [Albula glossodonta]KAG9331846.1 hypothetical protein JZ751_016872 [Albula glossodonta]
MTASAAFSAGLWSWAENASVCGGRSGRPLLDTHSHLTLTQCYLSQVQALIQCYPSPVLALTQCYPYERVDEIIWVKTNQLQRIIRTGRTGHWLNHGKEHCLVGVKGNPQGFNRGLDCDVIVAEVRSTSHKPDEIYGMIERLSPGTRKIELFGRPHNVQPNWVTLGNQLDGIHLLDPDVVARFKKRYPDGVISKPKNMVGPGCGEGVAGL